MGRVLNRLNTYRNYPYTNARVRAMRAQLITDSEYQKMEKMTLQEIAEFLSNRGYSDAINELGARYEGEELIGRAVNRHLSNVYMKLIRISPDNVQDLLWAYYRKFEIENLKTILREKMRDADTDVADALFPTPNMDRETLQRYLEMDTVDEVLAAFDIHGIDHDLQSALSEKESLQEIEDTLDRYYYEQLHEQAWETGATSELFERFLELEVALMNIELVLRLKRRDYDADQIMERILAVGGLDTPIEPDELARADTYDEAVNMVEDALDIDLTSLSPTQISHALERYKLQQGITMLHRDQLSVNPILGFMICKEIEVSNIRLIVRAKEENLGQDFIERNLIRGVATQ